jgi:hypothetical protein
MLTRSGVRRVFTRTAAMTAMIAIRSSTLGQQHRLECPRGSPAEFGLLSPLHDWPAGRDHVVGAHGSVYGFAAPKAWTSLWPEATIWLWRGQSQGAA